MSFFTIFHLSVVPLNLISSRYGHPENAREHIETTPAGMVISVDLYPTKKPPSNAPSEIIFVFSLILQEVI